MNNEAVREVVVRLLRAAAPGADVDALRPTDDVREALDLDSLDFLRFVTSLHKELGVAIPEVDYPRVTTLGGCVEYLAPSAQSLRVP